MFKKIISLLLVTMMCIGMFSVGAFADSAVLSISNATAEVGDTFTMNVSVSGNSGFVYCKTTLSYDTSVLELTGITGDLMSGATINVSRGMASFASAENVMGDGTLITASFRVLDSAKAGTAVVSVTATMQASGGAFLMNGAAASGTVTITHTHTWSDWEVTSEATCTEPGERTRKCSSCGESETKAIPALGHTWGQWETVTEAQCEKDGLEKRVCEICGEEETKAIPATGHSFADDFTVDVEPTCAESGSKSRHCTNCDETTDVTEIPALDHEWSAWEISVKATCVDNGAETRTCSRCGEVETRIVSATGHVWSAWVEETPATCTEEGKATRTCNVCDEVETRSVPVIEHTLVKTEAVPATCEENGVVEHYTCTACGKTFKAADGKEEISDTVIAALGHDYKGVVTTEATCETDGIMTYTCQHDESHTYTEAIPATGHTIEVIHGKAASCTEAGYETYYKCSVCEKIFSDEDATTEISEPSIISALGHDLEKVEAVAATCEKDGNIEYYICSVCGGVFADENGKIIISESSTITHALGHDWSEYEVTTEPTCTEPGKKTSTCTRCGETKTEAIAALGHDYKSTAIRAATCERDGEITHQCMRDNSHSYVEILPATGHDYDDGVITNEPTCTEAGIMTFTCKNCGDTYEEEIDMLPHEWDEGKVMRRATNTKDGEILFSCKNCDATRTETFELVYGPIVIGELVDKDNAVKQELRGIIQMNEGFEDAQIEYLDVSIEVCDDNSGSYGDVTETTEPIDGMTIILPYPPTTNRSDYDFIVLHKLSDGKVEYLQHTLTDEGLEVTVTSFSPFAIGYKLKDSAKDAPAEETEKPENTETPVKTDQPDNKDDSSKGGSDKEAKTIQDTESHVNEKIKGSDNKIIQTGDTTNILIWVVILIVCAAAGAVVAVILYRKRNKIVK